jgi:MFS transporter, DHA3 family, macrolide efflux protein
MKKIINQFRIEDDFFKVLNKNKEFRKLFWARVLSLIGTQMHRFGLPYLVYSLSGSAALMAINFTLSLIPGLIFGFMGGVLADRFNRRVILIIGDLLAGLVTLSYCILVFFDIPVSTWYLFALTFILSSLTSIYNPTFDASLPKVISKDNIVVANSLFSVSNSFISLGGPVFAGVLIGFIGPWMNIFINSLSFIASAFLIYYIKSNLNSEKRSGKNSILTDIKEGINYIQGQVWFLYGLFITFGVFLASGSVGSLIQYYLIDYLNLEGFKFGLTFALFEFIPLLLVGVYAPVITKRFRFEVVIVVGSILFGLSLIGLGATTIYGVVILFGMLLNGSSVLVIISWNSMRQRRVPNHLLGKVSGLTLTVQSTALPLGGAISSLLVNYISAQWTIASFGAVAAIVAIYTAFTPFTSKYKESNNISKVN